MHRVSRWRTVNRTVLESSTVTEIATVSGHKAGPVFSGTDQWVAPRWLALHTGSVTAPDPAPSPPVVDVTVTQPPGWSDLVQEVQRIAESLRVQPSPSTFSPEWWLEWAPILLGVVTAGVAILTIWRALNARPVPLVAVKNHSTGPDGGPYAFDGDIAYAANVGRLAMIVEAYGFVESNGTLTKRNGHSPSARRPLRTPTSPSC